MKSFNKMGIRQKFQLILAGSFFLIGLFIFFYFPLTQKNSMVESLEQKAKLIGQMVAKTSAGGLVFDDASSVTTQLEAFKEMHDVEFAIVIKKDGSKFSVYNENKYNKYSSKVQDLLSSQSGFFFG